jgi:hypothetical protein
MAAPNTNPIFEKAPNSAGVQIAPADTTAKKTLITADATNGSRVDAINVSSNDTASVTLLFYVTIGATDFFRGSVTIPTLTGYSGAATIDCVPFLAATLGYLPLPAGSTLKVAALATVTAAKVVDIITSHGDY